MDKRNGNALWGDAINKELSNVMVAFQLVEDGDTIPVGSKLIPYHIIFDVKTDLTRKARCRRPSKSLGQITRVIFKCCFT